MSVERQEFSLVEELVLLLLNEESGYMQQVAGWNLSCAIAGATLAELSLHFRIDMDFTSLTLLDKTPTGDELLDSVLADIAAEPSSRSLQYWIEKNAPLSDTALESTLAGLVEKGVLTHSLGGFWSLSLEAKGFGTPGERAQTSAAVRQRIVDTILSDLIPDPRDAIVIGLANACDAFRSILQPEEYETARQRIEFLSQLDLVGQAVATAVTQSSLRLSLRSHATKPIPNVKLMRLCAMESFRKGNSPKILADLQRIYGPVFAIKPPFADRVVVLAGDKTNMWVNRHGRLHLTSNSYIEGLEEVFGASRSLSGMEGADHYRMRKAQRASLSRANLWERRDTIYASIRGVLRQWQAGEVQSGVEMCRHLMSGQTSEMNVGIDTSEYMHDVLKYKDRALLTHVQSVLPKVMLRTPAMRRMRKRIDEVYSKIYTAHTAAQRRDGARDLIDDLMSLHRDDPQFFPEVDMTFALIMPLITAIYMANELAFALYCMLTRPDLHRRVEAEADALFSAGDPGPEAFTAESTDVSQRLLTETMRLYPAVPIQLRDVNNTCIVEGYEIPVGTRVLVASTAAHYMPELYPEPEIFDIDRHLPDSAQSKQPGAWGLFGLGTHTCLGQRLAETQILMNLLMLVHYFELEVCPRDYQLQLNPFPTNAPRKRLRFRIRALRHAL